MNDIFHGNSDGMLNAVNLTVNVRCPETPTVTATREPVSQHLWERQCSWSAEKLQTRIAPRSGKRVSGPQSPNCAGSTGISIVSVDPYTIDTGVEPRALVQRVTVSVPYNMSAFPALKFPKFTGFNADIMRPDYKEPGAQEPLTLLPGKGDFNANY